MCSRVQSGQECSTKEPHVHEAIIKDAEYLEPRLRDIDKKEVLAVRENVEGVLSLAIEKSLLCYSIYHRGKPIGMFGLSPSEIDFGIPWLLCSNKLPRVALSFLKQCPEYVNQIHEHYKTLTNYVHCENVVAIKWLKYLGFKMLFKVKYGRNNEMYYQFMRIQNV